MSDTDYTVNPKTNESHKWEIRFYKTVLTVMILLAIDIYSKEINIFNSVLLYLNTVIQKIAYILLNPY